MIILDANILLYAYTPTAVEHARARACLEELLSGPSPVGLPWQSVLAFLRVATNPRLSGARFSLEHVLSIVDGWLAQPNIRMLGPADDHWPFLRKVIRDGQVQGTLISDAHLAALTIEHGGVLYTADRDFARFPGLRWTNPLT